MEGGKDEQRKRHVVASRVQSKPYRARKPDSPYTDIELAEAESEPKHSPRVALTSCHPSSCRPAALTSQLGLRPCLCLSLPSPSRRRRLWLCWPFAFRWWRP